MPVSQSIRGIPLETLLPWSEGREVSTRRGKRILRKALPSLQFRALWRKHKDAMCEAGLSWGVNRGENEWEVCWLQNLDPQADEAGLHTANLQSQETKIPAQEKVTLYPFQKRGVLEILRRKTVLLGDEMGLGKSAQVIETCNTIGFIHTILIICPASLKTNWKREFSKFGSRPYSCYTINGKPKALTKQELRAHLNKARSGAPQIIVINWDILHDWASTLRQVNWSLIAADEVHLAKNPKTNRTTALVGKWDRNPNKRVPPLSAPYRIALTGTPVPNRPVELIPILDWLGQIRKLGGSWNFKMDFCDPKTFRVPKRVPRTPDNPTGIKWTDVWDFTGASNLDTLQDFLRSNCMIRRLKVDVIAELPSKTRQIIELPCPEELIGEEEEDREYWFNYWENIDELEEKVKIALKSEDKAELAKAVEKLSKARKVAFKSFSEIRKRTGIYMIEPALEHIKCLLEENKKLVIFGWHREVIETLTDKLKEYGAVHHYGGMSETAKQASVDKFQTDPECRIFVGNILSAGVGITLTAASMVLFVEADWVPGNLEQSEDRCHRIGAKDNVLVQYLVFEGSLGAMMLEKVVAKMKVQEETLDTRREKETT